MTTKLIASTVASQMEAASRAVVAQVLRDMADDLQRRFAVALGKFGRNVLQAPDANDDAAIATRRLVTIAARLDDTGRELLTLADSFAPKPRKPQRRHVA